MSIISSSQITHAIQSGVSFHNKKYKEKKAKNQVYVFGKIQKSKVQKILKAHLHAWQWQELEKNNFKKKQSFQTENGLIYFVPLALEDEKKYTPKQLHSSLWGHARDEMGAFISHLHAHLPVELIFVDCHRQQMLGSLLGIGLAKYSYKIKKEDRMDLHLDYIGTKLSDKDLKSITEEYKSVNLARQLVNFPAGDLHPSSYVQLIKDLFKKCHLKIWSPEQLKKEGMGLILGVGKGACNGPYMVQISYRGSAKSQKPIAFVGKGITFDSGGLDIKPAPNMRLMKKDMGGSATLLGVAYYLMSTRAKVNCDFYLAIAENTISHDAFRPGDVLHSKKGLSVEIHNTDAEGRLVMADALYTAATQKEKPRILIDVATLTGAVKYGLGSYLPGLFCTDEKMQNSLLKSAHKKGEPLWPMPLDPQQESALHSNVADYANCSDGFGGAISAALFLQKFTEDLPWAHFDIYAWNDSPRGALREKGGSGQMVQALLNYLGVTE